MKICLQYDTTHDFLVWLRTSSHPVDIIRLQSHTENKLNFECLHFFVMVTEFLVSCILCLIILGMLGHCYLAPTNQDLITVVFKHKIEQMYYKTLGTSVIMSLV